MNISGADMDATSKKISQLIDESGLTDKELGEIMGLSVQSINKWRHGHNIPDIENLFFLSRIFGIKVDDFLIPSVIKPQLVAECELITEAKEFSTSAIRCLWFYFTGLNKKCLSYPLTDSFT